MKHLFEGIAMDKIVYKEIEAQLVKAINQNTATDQYFKDNQFELVGGIINTPLMPELTSELTLGGPTIPMVLVVNKKTKELKFFPLRALLPNLTMPGIDK